MGSGMAADAVGVGLLAGVLEQDAHIEGGRPQGIAGEAGEGGEFGEGGRLGVGCEDGFLAGAVTAAWLLVGCGLVHLGCWVESSTRAICSPIQRITGTAIELPAHL